MDEGVLKLNYEVALEQELNLPKSDHFMRIGEEVSYFVPVYRANIDYLYLDRVKRKA